MSAQQWKDAWTKGQNLALIDLAMKIRAVREDQIAKGERIPDGETVNPNRQ